MELSITVSRAELLLEEQQFNLALIRAMALGPSSSLHMPRTWTKRDVAGCSSDVSRRRSEEGLYGAWCTKPIAVNVPAVCPANDLSAMGFYFKEV